jgi:hypothetical protein
VTGTRVRVARDRTVLAVLWHESGAMNLDALYERCEASFDPYPRARFFATLGRLLAKGRVELVALDGEVQVRLCP